MKAVRNDDALPRVENWTQWRGPTADGRAGDRAQPPTQWDWPTPSLSFKQVNLEETSETSANASAGDLDGDGDLDIVLAKGRHWPLPNRVLLKQWPR